MRQIFKLKFAMFLEINGIIIRPWKINNIPTINNGAKNFFNKEFLKGRIFEHFCSSYFWTILRHTLAT